MSLVCYLYQFIRTILDNPKRRVGQKNLQAWGDEQVTVYHCYDRLVNYKFVAVIDFDEFIVPHQDRNFRELFVSIMFALLLFLCLSSNSLN